MKLISREIDIVRQLRAVNLAQPHPAYLNFKENCEAAINCKLLSTTQWIFGI